MPRTGIRRALAVLCAVLMALGLSSCAPVGAQYSAHAEDAAAAGEQAPAEQGNGVPEGTKGGAQDEPSAQDAAAAAKKTAAQKRKARLKDLAAKLKLKKDLHRSLNHGSKPAKFQKYIVLHDTESDAPARDVLSYWLGDGRHVAAHFIVNKDGSVLQCVRMDAIAHHAGYGDTGHNKKFGVRGEGRDDKRGTKAIGSWARDYGMNSYSIGIELVHSGNAAYPRAQLKALDRLIKYIDTYYGFESRIIDHKAWRSGNSDTSPAFKGYLKSYQKYRSYKKPEGK